MLSSRSLPVANSRCIMVEWPKRWMLRLPETTDRGVDTVCICNCHCLCLWLISEASVCSGFVMIAQASGLGMGVARFPRPLRGVGVLAMLDVGMDTTREHWVCLYGSAWCWCVKTACTRHGGWSNYCALLWCWRGGRPGLSDICNVRIVQRWWGRGVLTLDCTAYGTPYVWEIPLTSRYGNASLTRGKLRIPCRPTLLLILTIGKTLNISYNRRRENVIALRRPHPIWILKAMTVGIISSAWI